MVLYQKFVWVMVAVFACVSLQAALPRLPTGLEYPPEPLVELPDPLQAHVSCGGCGELAEELLLHDHDFVGHRVNIDFYAPRWTGALLTFEVGYHQVWKPEDAYRLYATGPQGQLDYVQFIGRDRLVVFKLKRADDDTVTLPCISHQDYQLYRQGKRIVIEQKDGMRWYFASADYGDSWRLERLEEIAYAAMGVNLIYEEERLAFLIYPDGKQARFDYNGEFMSEVHFPNRYVAKIDRYPNGYPSALNLLAPSAQPAEREISSFEVWSEKGKVKQRVRFREETTAKPRLFSRHAYEHDEQGRIRHYFSPCGQEFSVVFASEEQEDHSLHVAVITDLANGAFRFMRHQAKGKTWLLEYGEGRKGQTMDQATVTERRVKQKEGFRMITREVQFGAADPVRFDLSKLRSAEQAKAPRKKTVEARDTSASPAAFTFERDPRGLPLWAIQGDQRWKLHFDELGRIDFCQEPGGTRWRWTYTTSGQLETRSVQRGPAPDAPVLTTRYRYTLDRRLRRVTYPDTTFRGYEWNCGEVAAYRHTDGQVTHYRYNDRHLLRSRKTTNQEERFDYYPDGRLHRRYRRHQGKTYQLVYHYQGGSSPVAVTGHDPALPADDRRVARRARHYQADGSYVDATYNARGLLLRQTASNGRSQHLRYTPDGEPMATDQAPVKSTPAGVPAHSHASPTKEHTHP